MATIPSSRSGGLFLQSVGVELGDGESPLRTPVVKDVFDIANQYAESTTVVWTNFDLIVKENFYEVLVQNLERQVGFSVLRLDMLIERAKHPDLSTWTMSQLYSYPNTQAQGGHDCLVFPTRWLGCLDYRNFVFGVGGWGYAIFGELIHLSKLEGFAKGARSGGFTVLKPGVHLDKSAITRHIGSQNANPKRYYSNPVPWLGPLRRNQLQYNMRMKFEVELQLSLAAQSSCRSQYFPSNRKEEQCATPTDLPRCPLKKSGALQPVGIAFPSASTVTYAHRVLHALMRMSIGTIHDPTVQLHDIARHPLVVTHAQNTHMQIAGPWDAHNITSQPTEASRSKWGPPAWDAVLLLVDPNPIGSILSWYHHDTVSKSETATIRKLQPLVKRYIEFYEYWVQQYSSSGIPIVIIDFEQSDLNSRAAELTIAAEVIVKAKLGTANRWCRGAPAFNVCCALNASRTTESVRASPEIEQWLLEELQPIRSTLSRMWKESRRRYRVGDISGCCPIQGVGIVSYESSTVFPPAKTSSYQVDTAISTAASQATTNPESRLETRRDRVARALPMLTSLMPKTFDSRFKAPCWKSSALQGNYLCFPSFFLLGQVKCGTTDFFSSLARHNQILRTIKEQHWFSREWYKGDKYLSQFSFPESVAGGREPMLIGDGTPDYIWAHLRCLNRPFKYPNDGTTVTIAEALAELNPAAKLLLMLREPVCSE